MPKTRFPREHAATLLLFSVIAVAAYYLIQAMANDYSIARVGVAPAVTGALIAAWAVTWLWHCVR